MDDNVKERISDKVTELSEYLPKDAGGALVVPVNMGIILDKFNLKAYDVKFKRPDVSGAFDRKNRQIYLNSSDPYSRKMFTLAHELGHYFLHQDIAEDILYRERNTRGRRRHMECEADQFAAELLMPERTIRVYWTVTESIQQLASIFSVSYLAMKTRLQSLGFI